MYQNPHKAFVASTCFQPARSRGPAAGTAWRKPPRRSPSQEAGRWRDESCYYQYRHSYWQNTSHGFCSLSLDRQFRVKYGVSALKEEVIPELEHNIWKFSGLKTSQSLLTPSLLSKQKGGFILFVF